MFIQHNNLRMYRKRSPLMQADLAFILKLPDYSNISRWEAGLRKPDFHALLVYHLLFEVPIESFFERQKDELADVIKDRVIIRIQELQALPSEPKVASRITFLQSVLTKLSTKLL